MPESLNINHTKNGISFYVKVLPRSAQNLVAGIHDGNLKIKLTAAPVDGKANAALIAFLAKSLNISKNTIAIIRGETSSLKQILLKTSDKSIEEKLRCITGRTT